MIAVCYHTTPESKTVRIYNKDLRAARVLFKRYEILCDLKTRMGGYSENSPMIDRTLQDVTNNIESVTRDIKHLLQNINHRAEAQIDQNPISPEIKSLEEIIK